MKALFAAFILIPISAWAQNSKPDPRVTPGAVNPQVTQTTIDYTICRPGWAKSVRPPSRFTSRLKSRQLQALGLPHEMRAYEEDHLIPIELGGDPDSPQNVTHPNLWPEPYYPPDGWGAEKKDALENRLHELACHGQLSLVEAQRAIATDWTAAYRRFVQP